MHVRRRRVRTPTEKHVRGPRPVEVERHVRSHAIDGDIRADAETPTRHERQIEHAADGDRVSHQRAGERQRQEAVRDRRSERRAGPGALRIDVNPLTVAGGIREGALQGTIRVSLIATNRGGLFRIDAPTR